MDVHDMCLMAMFVRVHTIPYSYANVGDTRLAFCVRNTNASTHTQKTWTWTTRVMTNTSHNPVSVYYTHSHIHSYNIQPHNLNRVEMNSSICFFCTPAAPYVCSGENTHTMAYVFLPDPHFSATSQGVHEKDAKTFPSIIHTRWTKKFACCKINIYSSPVYKAYNIFQNWTATTEVQEITPFNHVYRQCRVRIIFISFGLGYRFRS